MGKRAKKGSQFERWFAKELSKWWTYGDRDDVFWRVGGSGGRARVRGRKGQKTYGEHDDIRASDPIGDPLIQMFTIECKKGYSCDSVMDMVDRARKGKGSGEKQYEEWFRKCTESADQANSFAWMLVTKKDCREPLVFVPSYVLDSLEQCGFQRPEGVQYFSLVVRKVPVVLRKQKIACMLLDDWFEYVTPSQVRNVLLMEGC